MSFGGEGGIDSLATLTHLYKAHFVRPKSLRDLVEQDTISHPSSNFKATPKGPL